MDLAGPFAQISIGILTNLLYELGKRPFAPSKSSPLHLAMVHTVGTVPEFEGLRTTLEQWLLSTGVRSSLEAYANGTKGLDDLRIANRAQVQVILHCALQLRRVFDRDHTIIRRNLGKCIQNRVDERSFSAPGRTHNEDVLSRAYSGADDIRMAQSANRGCEIIAAA